MNLSRSIAFAILPVKSSKAYTLKKVAAAGTKPAEILVHGPIGGSYWSDEGISAKDFIDALNEIPIGQPVIVGINSQGGAVGDGMAIYNAIERRKADVTARIDGYAISIASFFPLAAGKVISPKSSVWMIHNAWSFAQGNAEEMRQAGKMLDTHDQVLVSAYVKKTGKSEKEIRDALAAETWLSGEQAIEWKLADEESDNEPDLDALDFSNLEPKAFKHIPAHCSRLIAAAAARLTNFPRSGLGVGAAGEGTKKPAASSGGAESTPMKKEQIIALLKKHGIQVPDNATDEQLLALVDKIPVHTPTAKETKCDKCGATMKEGEKHECASKDKGDTNVIDLAAELKAIREERARERREKATKIVDQCISECRIPFAQRDAWINRAASDEKVLDDLRAMPQHRPGEEPVAALIDVKSDAITDVVNHFNRLSEPRQSMLRGNSVKASEIYNAALATAIFYKKHAERLGQVFNTNALPDELKRQVILQVIMRAFALRILPLRAFSTVFENVPLEGTNKIEVPFYDLDAVEATNFVQADGYQFGNSTTTFRELEINKRKYKGLAFNSAEMRRQPYLNIVQIATLAAERLGVNVFTDFLSLVTAANYGAAVKNEAAAAFDSDDVIDIKTAANKANWPEVGRSLILDSDYDGNLQKDASIKLALNFGGTEVIRGGKIPKISGFDYYENPNIPDNGENLKGMALFQSAALFATAPILPAPGVRKLLVNYEVIVEPELGIAFEYRYWGEPQPDSDFEVIECNYGYGKGNASALKRITTP